MKQLLEQCGPHLIVALNDEVHVLLKQTSDDDDGTTTSKTVAVQLVNPSSSTTGDGNSNDDNNNNDDDNDNVPKKKKRRHNQTKQEEKEEEEKGGKEKEFNAIQAVTVIQHEDTLYCAVSRQDKTLSMYSIPMSNKNEQAVAVAVVEPYWNHNTPKRCCSLAFSIIDSKSPQPVLVTADLTGDAFAYPIILPKDQAKDSKKNQRRLLMGHTASMLTCVKINQQQQRILTSDRDEKIRVSAFPQTHIIHDYLLGHKAFVSSMDLSDDSESCSRCVSGSGDGTVRVWDYMSGKELYKVEPIASEEQQPPKPKYFIPSTVAMSRKGTMIAIARDSSTMIQILHLSPSNECELVHTQEIKCPGQPLSVLFQKHGSCDNDDEDDDLFILTSDSTQVLLHYHYTRSSQEYQLSKESTYSQSLQTKIEDSGSGSGSSSGKPLKMPITVMEYKYSSDDKPQKLKMLKNVNPVGFDEDNNKASWNNSRERKEKDRLKQARIRKRRREAKNKDNDDGNDNDNEYNNSEEDAEDSMEE